MAMTNLGKIQAGDPVILINAKKLGEFGLSKGMKGFANSVTHIEDKSYVFFMPDNIREVFVIERNRVILDEERLSELKKNL